LRTGPPQRPSTGREKLGRGEKRLLTKFLGAAGVAATKAPIGRMMSRDSAPTPHSERLEPCAQEKELECILGGLTNSEESAVATIERMAFEHVAGLDAEPVPSPRTAFYNEGAVRGDAGGAPSPEASPLPPDPPRFGRFGAWLPDGVARESNLSRAASVPALARNHKVDECAPEDDAIGNDSESSRSTSLARTLRILRQSIRDLRHVDAPSEVRAAR